MFTCKDCVHYGVCIFRSFVAEYQGGELAHRNNVCCQAFKNKADLVEVKHGEWVVDVFPKQGKKFITCSECRSVIDCNVTYVDENEYDFCPYCGADMRKEGADNG